MKYTQQTEEIYENNLFKSELKKAFKDSGHNLSERNADKIERALVNKGRLEGINTANRITTVGIETTKKLVESVISRTDFNYKTI